MRPTTKAVQVFGGYGYTAEYPVERMMRDAKVCEIGEGTSEIQRIVIARQVLGKVVDGWRTTHPGLAVIQIPADFVLNPALEVSRSFTPHPSPLTPSGSGRAG